jgi:hypothetical protein
MEGNDEREPEQGTQPDAAPRAPWSCPRCPRVGGRGELRPAAGMQDHWFCVTCRGFWSESTLMKLAGVRADAGEAPRPERSGLRGLWPQLREYAREWRESVLLRAVLRLGRLELAARVVVDAWEAGREEARRGEPSPEAVSAAVNAIKALREVLR